MSNREQLDFCCLAAVSLKFKKTAPKPLCGRKVKKTTCWRQSEKQCPEERRGVDLLGRDFPFTYLLTEVSPSQPIWWEISWKRLFFHLFACQANHFTASWHFILLSGIHLNPAFCSQELFMESRNKAI